MQNENRNSPQENPNQENDPAKKEGQSQQTSAQGTPSSQPSAQGKEGGPQGSSSETPGWKKPVTNEDEQRKATNVQETGEGSLAEDQKEGA